MENYYVVANATADGRYSYETVVVSSNGRSKRLIDLAGDMNSYIEKENGWTNYHQWPPVTRLGPGRWGTDINVCRIAKALTLPKDSAIDTIAAAIHEGWAECFTFWYEHQPWKKSALYAAPGRALESRGKIERAQMKFEELDGYQKSLCRQMAVFVKTECM